MGIYANSTAPSQTSFIIYFIADSSACTTTELSILLTSCLTAIKKTSLNIAQQFMKEINKKVFWSVKNAGKILNKLKSIGFPASGLSTYNFSTLYTTLPHNLMKKKSQNCNMYGVYLFHILFTKFLLTQILEILIINKLL